VAVVGAGIMGSGIAQLAAMAGGDATIGLRNLVAAGRLGGKTGRGIYDYDERGAIRLPSPS
jgi:3-hydroxyacyl-CoA dehydrogenase